MLYFVPTPIGNLEDISVRALRLLTTTPIIYCEDTRVTKKLITLLKEKHNLTFTCNQTFISLHSHNEEETVKKLNVEDFLQNDVLYVSDAGMPGISDPGILLVEFAQKNGIKYEVLPGANAALVGLVSSGFSGNRFYFYGFLPHKNEARKSELTQILSFTCNVILYESTHRILKLTEEFSLLAPNREIFIIKEATKKYETHFLGTAKEVHEKMKNSNTNGEFVVILKGLEQPKGEALTKEDILSLNIPNKQKAKLLSKMSGISTKEWYEKLNN
ncbi:MAG: 16S rRNA (cytidine(1402)-2'-O)-methyltransferase [Campylobacteraceae bacterium]